MLNWENLKYQPGYIDRAWDGGKPRREAGGQKPELSNYIIKIQQQSMKPNRLKPSHSAFEGTQPRAVSKLAEIHPQAEHNKSEHLKTRKQQNEDLDWLEEIVHQFEFYKDLKDISLFKDNKEIVDKSYSVEGLLQKVGLPPNLYRNSQRKQGRENCRPPHTKSKQIKHEIIHKNLAQLRSNAAPRNTKTKRSESEGSGLPKKKQIPRSNKQNAKQRPLQKQLGDTLKKVVGEAVEFCGIRDIKDDLLKMKTKLSMPESKPNCNRPNKVVMMKENRKNLLQAMIEQKSVGRIVKNKSVELKQRKNNCSSLQNLNHDNCQIQIENLLSRSRQNKMEKVEINLDKYNLLQIPRKQPLREQMQNIQLTILEKEVPLKSQVFIQQQESDKQREESKRDREDSHILKNPTQTKKFNYLSEKNLENRYQKICQKKQRKLNSSFGDRKLPQAHIINEGEKKNTKLQPVVEQEDQNFVVGNQNKNSSGAGPGSSNWYQRVKLVESTKNSQVFTEHSIVIDKNQITMGNEGEEVHQGEDWNILQIFQKLDRKKLGYLNASNCCVQNLTKEIRFIIGAVLDEITKKNVHYTFAEFISRVETTLQPKYADPFSKNKICQDATQSTHRQGQAHIISSGAPSRKITDNFTSCKEQNKKYAYSKVFIDDIETEPVQTNTNTNKVIRFATFQDEEMTTTVGNQEKGTDRRVGNQQKYPKLKDIEKLEIKLEGLSQFKSKHEPTSKYVGSINDRNPSTYRTETGLGQEGDGQNGTQTRQMERMARQRSYSEVGKKDYKNEIVKLEMLHDRLQKYLRAQTLKEFSSSKLLADGA